ncbi:hypothetical protein [Bradyrhizobium valentinum]|uniref:hypothetical protein n=1 Tax=Bradyrhizobium valentinum TaxID=1518501 RepID=UPI0012E3A58C|nr:hypothetical protein [Bradyrhizobium valentinum]
MWILLSTIRVSIPNSERHDAVFSDAIDPDEAVLGVHFTDVLGDAIYCGEAMDVVDA